jgi:hypothetical protein
MDLSRCRPTDNRDGQAASARYTSIVWATQVYLRALNRSKAMEAVRDLAWSRGSQPQVVKAHTGFEPVPPP